MTAFGERASSAVTFGHWLPIVTFCPVNGLPDFLRVRVTVLNQRETLELYAFRKELFKGLSGQKVYMESIAVQVLERALLYVRLETKVRVDVELIGGRHLISIEQAGL